LYAVRDDVHDVLVFDGQTGAFARTLWTSPQAGWYDIVVGPDGNLYVSSFTDNKVLRYDFTTETVSPFIDSGPDGPTAIAFGPDGNLYLAQRTNWYSPEFNSRQILRHDRETGQLSLFIDLTSSLGIGEVHDMEFGPDGYLYVLDQAEGSGGGLRPRVVRIDGT